MTKAPLVRDLRAKTAGQTSGNPTIRRARHSYATWLIANGVDIATVSKLLGHSEITTTLRVYAHTIEDSGKEAVCKIDEQLAKAYGNRMATGRPGNKKSLIRQASSGAGGGNRTRNSCLEGKGITIMQRPRLAPAWLARSSFPPAALWHCIAPAKRGPIASTRRRPCGTDLRGASKVSRASPLRTMRSCSVMPRRARSSPAVHKKSSAGRNWGPAHSRGQAARPRERPERQRPSIPVDGRPRNWWAGLDLNQRTALAGQIYSLVPLTTRPPTHDVDQPRYVGNRSRSSFPARRRLPAGQKSSITGASSSLRASAPVVAAV